VIISGLTTNTSYVPRLRLRPLTGVTTAVTSSSMGTTWTAQYYDNLDSYTTGAAPSPNWTVVAGTTSTIETESGHGQVLAQTYAGASAATANIYRSLSAPTVGKVALWMKSPSMSSGACAIGLWDVGYSAIIGFKPNGSIQAYTTAWNNLPVPRTWIPDTWYRVEVRQMDFSAKHYHVWIDGADCGQISFVETTPTGLAHIDFWCADAPQSETSACRYDEICVFQAST
jgi:hypothetical protein